MGNKEIINLWKAYDKKLEESLLFNRQNAEEITRLKVRSFMDSMRPIKYFTIIIGVLWVKFVDILIFESFKSGTLYFIVSTMIQVLLTKLAIGIYIYQLILIQKVRIDDSILKTQEKIARLKSSTLWVARLLFLQIPVWSTFYWSKTMWQNADALQYVIQISITLIFVCLTLLLFFNISYQNKEKRWFRWIFNGSEWTPMLKAMELLAQVEEYKRPAV